MLAAVVQPHHGNRGDFRPKLHAADVTVDSFYRLDNRSVDEFMCRSDPLAAALVKAPGRGDEVARLPEDGRQFTRSCLTALLWAQREG